MLCALQVVSLIKASYRIRRDSAFVGDSRKSLTYQSNIRRLSNASSEIQNGGPSRRMSVSTGSTLPNGVSCDPNHIQLSVISENGNINDTGTGNGHVNYGFTDETAVDED